MSAVAVLNAHRWVTKRAAKALVRKRKACWADDREAIIMAESPAPPPIDRSPRYCDLTGKCYDWHAHNGIADRRNLRGVPLAGNLDYVYS